MTDFEMKTQDTVSLKIKRVLERTIWVCLSIIVLISTISIAVWGRPFPFQSAVSVPAIPMKVITAICLLLSSIAILSLNKKSDVIPVRYLTVPIGTFLGITGLLTLTIYYLLLSTGHESVLTAAPFLKIFLAPGKRMALLSSLFLSLSGCSIILLSSGNRNAANAAHILLIPAALIAYSVPVSYLLNVRIIPDERILYVALPSGIAFLALTIALFCLYPTSWLMKIITGRRAGSLMFRRLLPGLIILPLVIAWLRIKGEQMGIFVSEVGVMIVALTYTVCFIWLVWLAAISVNTSDEVRLRYEDFLARAQAIANIGSWEWDLVTGKLLWSDQMYVIFGEDKSRFTPTLESFTILLHPDDRDKLDVAIRNSISSGNPSSLEFRIRTRDGITRTLIAHAQVNMGPDQKAQSLTGTALDITDRKAMVDKIRESEERLRLASRAARAGTWDWNILTGKLTWSKELYDLFGLDPSVSPATFELWNNVLHPDDRAAANAHIAESLELHSVLDSEYRIIRPNGEVVWINSRGQGIYNFRGDPLRMAGICIDVTRRRMAEEAAQEAQERTSRVLQGIADTYYSLDNHWRFTVVNPAAERAPFNRPASELLGNVIWELYPHLDGTPIQKHYLDAAENRSMDHYEAQSPLNMRWYEVFMQGHEKGVDVYMRDITERKRMEERILSDSEKATFLANLSKMFTEPGLMLDDVFQKISRSITEYIGDYCIISQISPEGDRLIPVSSYHPDPEASDLLRLVLSTISIPVGQRIAGEVVRTGKTILVAGEPPERMKNFIRKEMRTFYVRFGLYDFMIIPLKNEGKVIGTISVIRSDPGRSYTPEDQAFLEVIAGRAAMAITNISLYHELQKSHLELEQKVIERTAELAKSEERFRNTLDNLIEGCMFLGYDWTYLYLNESIARQAHTTKEKLLGRTMMESFPGVEGTKVFKGYMVTMEKRIPNHFEAEFLFPDGITNWFEFHAEPVPEGIFVMTSDITLRKQAETDRIARQVAEQANRAKSEFLANMSHEIRTPLNAIIGFSDLLRSNISDAKQLSQVQTIQSSSKNLLSLINEILDLSKIEAGKMVIQLEPGNVMDVIREIETIFQKKAADKGIWFFVETEQFIPPLLLIDETRLRQILVNLVDNAIKFTDKGHVILTVDRKMREDKKLDLILSVEDTGIGIPADQHQRVFEAFSQVKGAEERKYGGTGLGLTITHRLVEMMGGSISLSSGQGEGTVFTVVLPSVPIIEKGKSRRTEETFDITTVHFRNARVLVVDDNAENRKLIVDLLSSSPLEILEAGNGREAVEIAKRDIPDLVLIDLRMPEMNGYEATRILKSGETTKAIPVIAISASPKIIMQEQSDIEIFDEFLMKPVIVAELVKVLTKYLSYEIIIRNKPVAGKRRKAGTEKRSDKLNVFHELVKTLEEELVPVYREVMKKQQIGQMEAFGKRLAVLGEKACCRILMDYATDICSTTEKFDVELLIERFTEFPDIIQKIKKNREG
jgi:PAS domain S-box-containing protein